jgi:hypothetical protein
MGLPSRFFEKKIVKDEKGDDITPFDGIRQMIRPDPNPQHWPNLNTYEQTCHYGIAAIFPRI